VSNGSSEENETLLKNKIYNNSKIRVKISKSVGKGSAVRWGLENAKFENIIIYDSDFSYDLKLIHEFFVNGNPKNPFMYARRVINKKIISKTSTLRLIAGYVFNFIVRKYLKISSKDTQAGLKFINLNKFFNATQFINNDYMYDVELFLLSRILKIEPLNVDVYEVSASIESNINLVDDSIEMFRKLKKIKVHYKNLF
tara:strand:+ start:137 stop:730 length:594 start_codon:yes stop_codon:yes gene_type:complete